MEKATAKRGKKQREPDQVEDADRLKAIYLAAKRDRKITQETISDYIGINQSAVSQYINGRIPLNVEALIEFATFFGVDFAEISPSIAEQVKLLGMKRPGDRFGSSKRPAMERIEQALSDLMIVGKAKARLMAAIEEVAIDAREAQEAALQYFGGLGKKGPAAAQESEGDADEAREHHHREEQ